MYKLSKDYEKLFSLLLNGNEAVGFVDYKWNDTDADVMRDVCKIVREKPYNIQMFVRGMGYWGLYAFHKDRGEEKNLFINGCTHINLEWIEP
jgi:hypothetical protein